MLIEVIFADHPIAKLHHPVSHIFDGIVMRYHDDGVAVFLVYRLDQLQDFLGGIIIQGSCRYCVVSKNDSFVQFCFSLAPIGARSGLCKRQIAQKKRVEQGTAPCSVLFYFLILFLQITL